MNRMRPRSGLALLAIAHGAFWTSMVLPGVSVKVMESGSDAPGWVCALYMPPMWPVNGTLILLPVAWWRWRRTASRLWRWAGILGAASSAVAQSLVLLAPRLWDVEALRVGYFVWLAASVAAAAAFVLTAAPQRTVEEPELRPAEREQIVPLH
jgi:hypothetical protein